MIYKTPESTPEELEVIEAISEIYHRLKYATQSPKRWYGYLRRSLIAKAIQGSNSIEGYHVTPEDAAAVAEGDQIDTDVETQKALSGYREALSYIVRLSDDMHFVFNEELIRSLHYMMMSYSPTRHPGQWRPGPIAVRRYPSKERVYDGPDGISVPSLMKELVLSVQGEEASTPVIVRAAMAHLNLVMIHPFSDGNGRMGRALQTFVLARNGILDPTFCSIEEFLGARANTELYYSVLGTVGGGAWHPENDARPWIRFCLTAHLQQAMTVQRRTTEIAKLWGDLEDELRSRRLPDRMLAAVYEAAVGRRVKSSKYQKDADISSLQVASRDLSILVDQGLLVAQGENRGRYYTAAPELFKIRERNREPRVRAADKYGEQLKFGL